MFKLYSPRVFRFFTIFLMASLCLLLNSLTQINFTKIKFPKDTPEYTASGVSGKIYNDNGTLMYQLKSEGAWQFPDNERLFMKNLTATTYNESNGIIKYNLTSNDGWINYNKKIGFMGKNSILTLNNQDPLQITKIFGDQINLDLNKNYFWSNSDIKAVQNKSIVTGHGFSYDQNTQFLTINSSAKVIIDNK